MKTELGTRLNTRVIAAASRSIIECPREKVVLAKQIGSLLYGFIRMLSGVRR